MPASVPAATRSRRWLLGDEFGSMLSSGAACPVAPQLTPYVAAARELREPLRKRRSTSLALPRCCWSRAVVSDV